MGAVDVGLGGGNSENREGVMPDVNSDNSKVVLQTKSVGTLQTNDVDIDVEIQMLNLETNYEV